MIATPRLLLRSPRLSDVPALFAFMGDAAAMRHTHTHRTTRELRRHLAGHRCQSRKIGCGPWTVIERATGAIIGFGGLYDDPFDPGWGIEIGYFFAPSAWGQGYASELVQQGIATARDDLALPWLGAFAHPANTGSRRVLEKAGFIEQQFVPAMDRFYYRRAL